MRRSSQAANMDALRRVGICAVVASPLLASDAHANEPTFFDRVIAWFNPNKAAPDTSAPDATPYTVTFEIAGSERSVRSAVTDASNLESLKRQAPAGAAGLIRRAVADRDRILAALYTEGRYAGTVTIIVAGRSPDNATTYDAVNAAARRTGPVPVKVLVEPGPVFKFGAVHVLDTTGRRPLPDAPTPKQMRVVEGEVARATDIAVAERVIVDTLRGSGHPFARIAAKDLVANHATRTLDVTFLVQEGKVATFGTFTVSGTQRLKPDFVEERIDIRPGEPYSPERLAKLRKRLAEYEAIASVRLREADKLDPNGQLPISIEVTEREPRYLGFGANYSATDGSVVNAYWGHRNLFGGGETLRLDAQVSWFDRASDAVPDGDPFGYKVAATFLMPGIYTPADDLVAQRLGFKVILDITAMKIPFASTVLVSARNTVARKQPELTRFMHAYAEAVHYFITNREGASQVIAKYTKVQDREVLNYAIETDAKAVQRSLEVDPKGVELILGLISKSVPQAASAKPEDFYDARFFTELKDSGFLKRLWAGN